MLWRLPYSAVLIYREIATFRNDDSVRYWSTRVLDSVPYFLVVSQDLVQTRQHFIGRIGRFWLCKKGQLIIWDSVRYDSWTFVVVDTKWRGFHLFVVESVVRIDLSRLIWFVNIDPVSRSAWFERYPVWQLHGWVIVARGLCCVKKSSKMIKMLMYCNLCLMVFDINLI